MVHEDKHPSQWVAGLIVIAAGIQGLELRDLAKMAGIKQSNFREVLAGNRGLSLDEAQSLCRELGFRCSVMAEMTMTDTHGRLMAVTMADQPPPHLVATRPEAA